MLDLKIILEFLTSSFTLLAAILAVFAVASWRKSYIGRRKIKLAQTGLFYFYKASDAIENIRHPLPRKGEGSSRERTLNEKSEHGENLDYLFVIEERYTRYSELFSKLFSLRHKFLVIFGENSTKAFDDMREALSRLRSKSRQCNWKYRYYMTRVIDGDKRQHMLQQTIEEYEAYCFDYGFNLQELERELAGIGARHSYEISGLVEQAMDEVRRITNNSMGKRNMLEKCLACCSSMIRWVERKNEKLVGRN